MLRCYTTYNITTPQIELVDGSRCINETKVDLKHSHCIGKCCFSFVFFFLNKKGAVIYYACVYYDEICHVPRTLSYCVCAAREEH